jgi:PAS domain S-box-containing protein
VPSSKHDETTQRERELMAEVERLRARCAQLEGSELAHISGRDSAYLSLVEWIGTAVYLVQDEHIEFTNREGERIAGASREELREISLFELFHTEDQQLIAGRIRARQSGEELDPAPPTRLINRQGEVRWISFDSHGILYRGRPALLGYATDITELHKIESALRQSESLFRTLAENTPAAIFLHQGAEYVYANPAASEITGYTNEELLSMGFDATVHPEHRAMVRERAMARLRGEAPPTPYPAKLVCKDGRECWVEIMATPLVLDGQPSVLGTAIDITERRRTEQEALRAQKLDSLGILAGGIAHDFNNLMTAILGNLSLARRRPGDPERVLTRLDSAEKAVLSARHLTEQLLTFSRGGKPRTELLDVEGLLAETTGLALSGSKVEPDIEVRGRPLLVHADEGQLSQVFSNLAINAVQAMPEGGVLRVVARPLEMRDGQVHELTAGRYVEIEFRDYGVGIGEDDLPHVFDPYFTTKPEGTGLGLSASYSIVRNHGGAIAIDSQLGTGTAARVLLPAGKGVPKGSSVPPPTEIASGKLLVMDDDERVLEVAIGLLEGAGHAVVGARDGAEALDLYCRAKEGGEPFDAVLLDLTVPGGMGGREALEQLRDIDPGVLALVSSGYSNDPTLADYRQHGFAGVVPKPYSGDELFRAVGRVLALRGAS